MNQAPLEILASSAKDWGAPLNASALTRLKIYLEDVQSRNASVNLTAEDNWNDLVLKHAADGVFAAAALRAHLPAKNPRILDLGSGAGFIGIALKIAWLEAEVTLMESTDRKFRFLNLESSKLGLPGLRVLRRRAGTAAPSSPYEIGFDAVIERALAPLPEALTLAAPCLKPSGVFAAFQTEAPHPADPSLARALQNVSKQIVRLAAYRRPTENHERYLVLIG